jgi:ketosteroid isomerase-like protein
VGGHQPWIDGYFDASVIPSVRAQASAASAAGSSTVTPSMRGEPQMVVRTLGRLQDVADAAEGSALTDLHRRILAAWTDQVRAITSAPVAAETDLSVFRAGYDTFMSGDLEAMHRWFAPDATLVVPGHTPFSGTFHGLAEIMALLTLASDRLRLDAPELVTIGMHGDALDAMFVTAVRRGHRSLRVRLHQFCWFNARGQIAHSELVFEEPDALEQFFRDG